VLIHIKICTFDISWSVYKQKTLLIVLLPMKKITIQFSLLTFLIGSMFLLSFRANAQDIRLSRTFNPAVINPGSTVNVTIFLDKGYRGGLARLDEFIPPGFTASGLDNNGSKFYVTDSIVKFAWQSMPSDPGFTVAYQLHVPVYAIGNYTLVAQFIYMSADGATTAYFKPFTIVVQPKGTSNPIAKKTDVPHKDSAISPVVLVSQSAPTVPITKVDTTQVKPVAPIAAKPVATKTAPVAVSAPKPVPPVPKPAPTPAPKPKAMPVASSTTVANSKPDGLWYRVQIMASANRLDVDSVIINGIRDKLYIITKNGISRYYIGAFHELQPALDYRLRIINNGLKGPFVCAYKDGVKIPIKEALQVVATN
jgi:cell division septation protein DedD